ncbi:motility associated factor glycosyltransferase family protein [Lysinibacillus sp. NPDC097287]|uniref:motility associated factor glycosyltransferase family protein n=1 Tax=Lysinibacillus sp. NPDC097287 TaxID=3364144 RepID=UPI00380E0786
MNWEVDLAKNGEQTLKLNDIQLYSNYRPREDAWKWVESQFDSTYTCYLIIGLGLGYHAEKLVSLANGKPVYVYYFDQRELYFTPIKEAVNDISHIDFTNCQILIPNSFLNALGNHPILPFLEDIKINQITYKKFAYQMEQNFHINVANELFEPYPVVHKKAACLIASGPSLNETIYWIKNIENHVDIFVVGSALKMVLAHQIKPTAVIISDAKSTITRQLEGVDYKGPLFYLSTASSDAVQLHKGPRYLLCQQGYPLAESLAAEKNLTLIESGGSVATTAFSLIEELGYKQLVLFGQDLGFTGNATHAEASTSGRIVTKTNSLTKIKANNGDNIYSTKNLQTFLRWFNSKMQRTALTVTNTAYNGAKIDKVSYVNEQKLYKLLKKL